MSFRRIGVLILVAIGLCCAPHDAYGGASDTWAQHKKVLIGEFNNWSPQIMSGPDSNGLYRVSVKLFPGMWQYKFGVVLNGTDTQYEPGFTTTSTNREVTVPTGVDTFYVPNNWADTPPKPTSVTTSLVGVGQVKLTWSEPTPGGLDVVHGGGYHVYYRAGAAGPPWTQADTQLLTATTYTVSGLSVGNVYYFVITAVDAYDTPGVPGTDSPAPPGPLMDTSSPVTDTPQGQILVQFIVDMRKENMKSGAPRFGMGLGGSLSPISWNPYQQPLREIQSGLWSESYVMQAGTQLEYKYVKNPGTSRQEWEGQGDAFAVLFRFDPASWGLSASQVTAAYVRGDMNGWSPNDANWKLTLESDSVFRVVKTVSGTQKYKYFVYHASQPTGEWIPGGGDLYITPSAIPTQFVYGPDAAAVSVYAVGEFDPWSSNEWQSSKPDDFYALTKDNRNMWRLVRNLPTGTHLYKFVVDSTNDGVKNGAYESGSNRTLNVTGNRVVTVASNYGTSMMRLIDSWEQAALAPPRTPVSISAVSMDSKVLISWRPSTEFVVNCYNVYRDTNVNGTFPLLGQVAAGSIPEYLDTAVTNGLKYYYKITAFDTSGLLESNYSSKQEGLPAAGNAIARRMADGQDTSVVIEFPSGSLPTGAYVRVTSMLEMLQEESTDSELSQILTSVTAAENAAKTDPLQWAISENTASDSDSLLYIVDVKSRLTGQTVTFADTPVRIKIPYTAAHEQFASGGLVAAGYALYVLNETTNRWELVPGSTTDKTNKIVGAPRYQFSVFQVMAVAGAPNNLDQLVVYPNPVYPNREFAQAGDPYGDGRPGATFINVPTDIEFIKIYTLTGELVRTLDPADPREYGATGSAAKMIWDLQNDAGRAVASGVYIFYAKSAASHRTGKVAVIR